MTTTPLTTAEGIDALIARAVTSGAYHHAELLRHVRRGHIAWIHPTARDTLITSGMLNRAKTPTLVTIGDDDYQSTGPEGWACANRVLRWARWYCIHAAGAEVGQYSAIALATVLHRRAVLVETSAGSLDSWRSALYAINRHPHGMIVIPRDGQHPIMPEQLQ